MTDDVALRRVSTHDILGGLFTDSYMLSCAVLCGVKDRYEPGRRLTLGDNPQWRMQPDRCPSKQPIKANVIIRNLTLKRQHRAAHALEKNGLCQIGNPHYSYSPLDIKKI